MEGDKKNGLGKKIFSEREREYESGGVLGERVSENLQQVPRSLR